jgi:ADP-ribose pyrophosphatase
LTEGGRGAGTTEADPDRDLREELIDSRVLHSGRYLTFRIDRIRRADGTVATRDVCGHPGAVAILALDDEENVLLVRQWRHPANTLLLEIPAGTLDVDEATGGLEDPALAARRELEEETGMRAGSWRLLSSFWTAPGFATELMHLYLATKLTPAHENRLGPDEDERLRVSAVPWRVAVAMAEAGEIRDAKSLVALLWLSRLMEHGEGGGPTSDAEALPAPDARPQSSPGEVPAEAN